MVFNKGHPAQLCRLLMSSESDAYRKYLDILNALEPDATQSVSLDWG